MTIALSPEMHESLEMIGQEIMQLVDRLHEFGQREFVDQSGMQEIEDSLAEHAGRLHLLRGFIKCERTLAYGTRQQQRAAKREAEKFGKVMRI